MIDDTGSSSKHRLALCDTVYEHLHAIAQRRLAHERPGHTLQATALVHEAFLRIQASGMQIDPKSENFLFAAAQAMRRILIDHARAKRAVKRGGKGNKVDWNHAMSDVADLANDAQSEKIEALDAAIVRLEGEDERCASLVKLRFYAGLTIEEAARALGISPRSAKRDWEYARAWLLRSLSANESSD